MPSQRYELEASARFWEITWSEAASGDAPTFHTRHGRIGTDGVTTAAKELDSTDALEREVEKRIATSEKKGYVLVSDPPPTELFDSELEARLRAYPGDAETLAALAAFWRAQDDPRGELAEVNAQLAADPDDAQAMKREAALLKKHGTHLLPSRFAKMLRKKRGTDKSSFKPESGSCAVHWEGGLLRSARVGRSSERPPHTVRELVADLLTHPSARALRELSIGALGPGNGPEGEYDYSEVITAVARHAPTTLRRLVVADFSPEHCELGWSSSGSLARVGAALPHVESLVLRAGALDLDGFTCPSLRELEVITTNPTVAGALAAAPWPALERLHVDLADAELDAEAVGALLTAVPALEDLALTHVAAEGIAAAVVAAAPAGLRSLELSWCSLDDGDTLTALVPALPNLQTLDVRGGFIGEANVAALTEACATSGVELRAHPQRRRREGETPITEAHARELAPDSRSLGTARVLSSRDAWETLGRDGDTLWGTCKGREMYEVYVDAHNFDAGCTCPSPKYPCKHTVALLLLGGAEADLPRAPVPEGLVERCGNAARSW